MRSINDCHQKHLFSLVMALMLGLSLSGRTQSLTPVEGLRDSAPGVHALTNVRIVAAPGQVIESGTIVIRRGVIEAIGPAVAIPADARVWDYGGKSVYPGLIETYSHLGLAQDQPAGREGNRRRGGEEATAEGLAHWSSRVRADYDVLEDYAPDEKALKALRAKGYTAALIVPHQGIFRGSSALVSLGDRPVKSQVIREKVAQHLSFSGRRRGGGYPNSLMGAIALIRQTLLDARWYQQARAAGQANPALAGAVEHDAALEALQAVLQKRLPLVIETGNDLAFLRALKLAKEFDLNIWIRGSGYEYRLGDQLKEFAGIPLILPVDFPEKLSADTPEEAWELSLRELQHWELAPENPRRLREAGFQFSLTAPDFSKQLPRVLAHGVSEDDALAALTINAAEMLGAGRSLGSIEPGKRAHLVVSDQDFFAEKRKIYDVWIDGERYKINDRSSPLQEGSWQMTLELPDQPSQALVLEIRETKELSAKLHRGEQPIPVSKSLRRLQQLFLSVPGDSLGLSGTLRLSGTIDRQQILGSGELADGRRFHWQATWQAPLPADSARQSPVAKQAEPLPASAMTGLGAFRSAQLPARPAEVLIQNATLWTSAGRGRLENSDLLIRNGKIAGIGQNLNAGSDAVVIDGTGKHVTPGIIDAHSHTAVDGSVNEATQAVTAEVRIGDVLDPYDIALYRELAGGVTTINILHGSANPIGGQNAVIKLRWGASADALRFENVVPGIKFALGENVKQSNWGDDNTTRYPQTRMGVEQIIRDRFQAARDYERAWVQYNAAKKKQALLPPRRDLELEALLEILQGKRQIHCHSYRQDEILMLTRVAEEFGFKVAAFQHVLEGYKVAEELARLDFGASTFSDWWAYKFEVYDAIPYNGALMQQVGVNVSFNSDSDELARRLNTEAAKAVKYGGLAPEEALKFVTINPARQLGIDERVGSLETGKDADFAIWSGDPLSTYTICEQTWIDGRKYFDRQTDLEMRREVRQERARIVQKYLQTSAKTDKAKGKGRRAKGGGQRAEG